MAVVVKKVQTSNIDKVSVTSRQSLESELEKSGLRRVPLDVVKVADHLGLKIIYEQMSDDISGFLEKRSQHWVVGVNSFHHKNRQRFTIAHEIAHYVLHKDQTSSFLDKVFARRHKDQNPMEREADQFAAEILMPESSLRQAIEQGCKSLQDLADRFQVSALAMKFRVQDLGYSVK